MSIVSIVSGLIEVCPRPREIICFDPEVKTYVDNVLFPSVQAIYPDEIERYCNSRDKIRPSLMKIKQEVEEMLNQLFKNFGHDIKIIFMSSVGSHTNLLGPEDDLLRGSDIDFGIVVNDNLTDDLVAKITTLLEKEGFVRKHAQNISSYISLEKDVSGVEIEVKIRSFVTSKSIINLHNFLDNLNLQTQRTITYIKYLTQSNPQLYSLAKSLIFTWGYTSM